MKRDALAGAAAGLTALGGMAGWAWLGVSLLGLGGAAVPAALALAVGGSAGIDHGFLSGSVSLLPLGISLVGAVLLTVVLTNWWRVAGAVAVFGAGLVVLSFSPGARGLLGGVVWLAVVVGVRVAMWRWPWVRNVAIVLVGAAGAAMVLGAVAGIAGGARALGLALLAAPNLLCVALTSGLGVPWAFDGPGLPVPDFAWTWPVAAVVVVLLAGSARWHAPWVVALCCAAMAWLGGGWLQLRVGPFPLAVGVTGDVLIAAGAGLAAGSVACLLVAGVRHWQGRTP